MRIFIPALKDGVFGPLISDNLRVVQMLYLNEIWTYNTKKSICGLAFSDNGNLGVASEDSCAHIFNSNGKLLNKVCGKNWMADASYSNGRFGFINYDDYAYITDENGNLIKKVYVGDDYDHAITMTSNGFVACAGRCAFFDFNGNKLWDVGVGGVDNGPAYYNGYWYVPICIYSRGGVLIIKEGEIVGKIRRGVTYDTAVCKNYLAVLTYYSLYLYDLSDPENPKEIWNVGEFDWAYQVAFSPDCKYIAVTEREREKLHIYNIHGKLVLEKKYEGDLLYELWSVAWRKNRLAVGHEDGKIYAYEVADVSMKFPLVLTP